MRTRATAFPKHVATLGEILPAALRLLRAEPPMCLRLMGLRMSQFLEVRTPPGQRSMAAFVRNADKAPAAGATAYVNLASVYETHLSFPLRHSKITFMATWSRSGGGNRT